MKIKRRANITTKSTEGSVLARASSRSQIFNRMSNSTKIRSGEIALTIFVVLLFPRTGIISRMICKQSTETPEKKNNKISHLQAKVGQYPNQNRKYSHQIL